MMMIFVIYVFIVVCCHYMSLSFSIIIVIFWVVVRTSLSSLFFPNLTKEVT